VAIAALGPKTNARALLKAESKPLAVIVINSALLASLVLGGLLIVGRL
jgi:uncharacterized membrane protein YadS